MKLSERIYNMKKVNNTNLKEAKLIQDNLENKIEQMVNRLDINCSFEVNVTPKTIWLGFYGIDGDIMISSVVIGELQRLITGEYHGQYSIYSQSTGNICLEW